MQDLIDALAEQQDELAGLLDGRRALTHPPCSFAPFTSAGDGFVLRDFYALQMKGRRVLLADDVRNTGATFERCASLVRRAGGTVIGTVEICDRLEAVAELDVPNYALTEYQAGLAIFEALLAKDPTNVGDLRGLAVSRERIANVLFTQGDAAGALEMYRAVLATAETLGPYQGTVGIARTSAIRAKRFPFV